MLSNRLWQKGKDGLLFARTERSNLISNGPPSIPMIFFLSPWSWLDVARKLAGRSWTKPLRLEFVPFLFSKPRKARHPMLKVHYGSPMNGFVKSKEGLNRHFPALFPHASNFRICSPHLKLSRMKLNARGLLWIIMRLQALCPPVLAIRGYLFRFAWDRNGAGPLEREHFCAQAVTQCITWVLGYFE